MFYDTNICRVINHITDCRIGLLDDSLDAEEHNILLEIDDPIEESTTPFPPVHSNVGMDELLEENVN